MRSPGVRTIGCTSWKEDEEGVRDSGEQEGLGQTGRLVTGGIAPLPGQTQREDGHCKPLEEACRQAQVNEDLSAHPAIRGGEGFSLVSGLRWRATPNICVG